MADKIKIVLALLLVAAGVVGFYYFSDGAMIVRVGSVLAGLVAALVVFWFTAQGRQFYAFSQESVAETKKVVWPTRKETLQTTGVVVLFMVVMALFLWAVDATLLWLVKMLMGRGE
ncbi:MAG: preprotein translocase subunit SecE [Pseudomonadota bacterium]